MFRRIDALCLIWSFIVLWGIPYFNHAMQFDYMSWYSFPLLFTEILIAISGAIAFISVFVHIAMEIEKK